VLDLLDNKGLTRKLRANARAYAEQKLGMDDYLASYNRLIERLTGENPTGPSEADIATARRPSTPARGPGVPGPSRAPRPNPRRLVSVA
jgi:hypothetical protein